MGISLIHASWKSEMKILTNIKMEIDRYALKAGWKEPSNTMFHQHPCLSIRE